MNLNDLFRHSLSEKRQHPALQFRERGGDIRSRTFGELDDAANRIARELFNRGFKKGDRLCIFAANSPEFVQLFLGCIRSGIIMVPVNTQYRERELTHILRDAVPGAVVVDSETARAMPHGAALLDVQELFAAASSRPATAHEVDVMDGDAALIIYTSGTTGTAKGAVLSHGGLAANGRAITDAWRITERDRYLAFLPLFHVHGLGNGIHSWLISGCTMRLLERFNYREAQKELSEFLPTLIFGVPTVYVRMLDDGVIAPLAAREIGRSARLFVSGSAPLPAHIHAAFESKFGHRILERYGMTEALMITSNPYDGERRAGSVGLPLAGVDLRVIGADGVACDDGEPGEIHLRSPQLFTGYWRNEQATRDAFVTGYFRTGDIGVRSPDGYYALRGRAGDLIISGGFNIYPREIEEVLLEHAGVRDAAVAGVPDPLQGEVPVAYIVVERESETLSEELTKMCREQLAHFKLPRAFVRVAELPRNAMGKVQKNLLPAV